MYEEILEEIERYGINAKDLCSMLTSAVQGITKANIVKMSRGEISRREGDLLTRNSIEMVKSVTEGIGEECELNEEEIECLSVRVAQNIQDIGEEELERVDSYLIYLDDLLSYIKGAFNAINKINILRNSEGEISQHEGGMIAGNMLTITKGIIELLAKEFGLSEEIKEGMFTIVKDIDFS